MKPFQVSFIILEICFFAVTTSLGIIEKRKQEIIDEVFDYHCGQVVFLNKAVQDAALASYKAFKKKKRFPVELKAPFYDNYLKRMIWPIKENGKIFDIRDSAKGIYFVVIDSTGVVEDVVVKTMSSQFIKCTKKSRSMLLPAYEMPGDTDGYDCGYDQFSDQALEDYANVALDKISRKKETYIRHKIVDSSPDNGHFIWPISKTKKYESLIWTKSLYYVILSIDKVVKGVKVKLMDGSLYSCSRIKLSQILLGKNRDDSPGDSGYQCGMYFFGINYLTRTAEFSGRAKTNSYKKMYPISYKEDPFKTEVLLYPIYPGGRIHVRGRPWKHYIVMSKSYKILSVAVKAKDGYHICEERSKSEEVVKETSSFKCGEVEFSHSHLLATSKIASENLGKKDRKYPAKYEGPDFDIPGPYLTWPLLRKGFFTTVPGNYRLVVNGGFHIAGVLDRQNDEIHKCERASDQSIPGKEHTGRIYEKHFAYSMDLK